MSTPTRIQSKVDPAGAPRSGPAPKFAKNLDFETEVRRRVNDYFRRSGRRQRDCWQMYLKTGILIAFLAATYVLLVFVTRVWWQTVPAAVLLGLAAAAVGLNVQHDGIHHAYSRHEWVNRMMAMTLDVMGGSSYLYQGQHVVYHHTYTNIDGGDTDIDIGVLARMSPHQPRRWIHRWQHYYLWPLYGFMTISWQLVKDYQEVITGRIHGHPFPRPKGWTLVAFIGGKAAFVFLAFVLPLLFHSFWNVALCYGVAGVVMGISLAVVFQLAHCVEQAAFPLPDGASGRIDRPWAVHEVETTVDFARRSPIVAWLLGGLNFQIEHHRFRGSATSTIRPSPGWSRRPAMNLESATPSTAASGLVWPRTSAS